MGYAPRGGLLIRNGHSRYLPKPKRNKMEIYNDILSAIRLELTNGEAKPTRVQTLSNLAYDKLERYLDELEGKNMILQNPLRITEKGQDFLQDYGRIRDFVLKWVSSILTLREGASMSADNYRPLKFLDKLEGNKHTVLLYDDQKYGDLIIARYLHNGLEKGESCIFFTSDSPQEVEKRLSVQGIDVDVYRHRNSLRIYQIERSDEGKRDTLATLRHIREEASKGMKPPYRFVGRTITDTKTIQGMKLGMVVEKTGHEHFAEFDNSQLCYYDISGLEQSKRDEWIRELLKNHHNVIYASEPDKAVAFETELLEEE